MKHSDFRALKKSGTIILSLLSVFVLLSSGIAMAQEGAPSGAAAGDAGLGAAGTIGPLGMVAIAAGTLAAAVLIAEAVTDTDSTAQHVTPVHNGE